MSPAATVLLHGRLLHRRRRWGALRLRARAYPPPGGDRARRLGRARDAGVGEPLRDLRGPSATRRPRCAAASTGNPIPYMDSNLTAGLFHASSSLGIAEGAPYRAATGGLTRRGVGLDAPRTQMLAAESSIDLVRLFRRRSPALRPSWSEPLSRREPRSRGAARRSRALRRGTRRRRRSSTTWRPASSTGPSPSPAAAAT